MEDPPGARRPGHRQDGSNGLARWIGVKNASEWVSHAAAAADVRHESAVAVEERFALAWGHTLVAAVEAHPARPNVVPQVGLEDLRAQMHRQRAVPYREEHLD